MGVIVNVLMVVQVLCAVTIIILVLLQHGKGADMGAAFGGGASGSLFGASGSANFLSRATAVVATIFFVVTIGLAYSATAGRVAKGGGLMSGAVPAADGKAPAPAAAPAPASAPAPADTGKGSDIPK